MTKGSKSTPTGNARSAVTGQFVTQHYAQTHPRTTVVEHSKGGHSKKS